MLRGQISTELLKTEDGIVRLCNDTVTGSCSIGIRTENDFEWKHISRELHDLLAEELSKQEGQRWPSQK